MRIQDQYKAHKSFDEYEPVSTASTKPADCVSYLPQAHCNNALSQRPKRSILAAKTTRKGTHTSVSWI